MDTPSFTLQQQACDPKIFKDNSTAKERIFFYVLLTFNLLLLAGACQNMVILWRRHSFKRISKILLLNTGMIATILFRLAYQFDSVFINYLSVPSYVFFGVGSVVLLDSVMLACAFYWYNAMIMIRSSFEDLETHISKIYWTYQLLMFLNLVGLSLVFWVKVVMQDCLKSSSLTAITSMIDGIIFTSSSITLWRFISDIPNIDPGLKENVKRGVYVGYCSIYRFIVDLTFLFPFSENWKTDSQDADNLAWPIFIFIYLFIGDIIPTALLLRVFVTHTKSSSRASSAVTSRHNESIVEMSDSNDSVLSVHSLSPNQTGTILYSCPSLLKGAQTFPTEQLKNFQVVVLFYSASSTSMSAEVVSKLKSVYEEVNKSPNALEVVFVSCDHDVSLFTGFYDTMPWAAVPFEEKQKREQLLELYASRELPEIFVLKKSGGIGTKSGRSDLEKYGVKAFQKWITLVE